MTALNLMEAEKKLNKIIPEYYNNKQEESKYKKLVDSQNTEIKECLDTIDKSTFDVDEYHAVKSISTRESFKEEALIKLLKTPGFAEVCENAGIIKTKEYVDYDALEKVVYNGEFSQTMLLDIGKCKEVKEVVTLKVTKKKEKK